MSCIDIRVDSVCEACVLVPSRRILLWEEGENLPAVEVVASEDEEHEEDLNRRISGVAAILHRLDDDSFSLCAAYELCSPSVPCTQRSESTSAHVSLPFNPASTSPLHCFDRG